MSDQTEEVKCRDCGEPMVPTAGTTDDKDGWHLTQGADMAYRWLICNHCRSLCKEMRPGSFMLRKAPVALGSVEKVIR